LRRPGDLVDVVKRVAFTAPAVCRLRGDHVIRIDSSDPIAVSKAKAAIGDRYADAARRWRRSSGPPPIHWMAARRILEIERLLTHRYGDELPDDDAGREDLVILLNHVAQNRHDPRTKVMSRIRRWAPLMAPTEADALADMVLKQPRKYKATTIGGLMRLAREERSALGIKSIRPFDKTKEEMAEDRRRRDRLAKKAKRAANPSARPRGRPKSDSARPWEVLGEKKSTYYDRVKRSGVIRTENASAVLEPSSYTADGLLVRTHFKSGSDIPVTGLSEPGAPATRRLASPVIDIDVIDVEWVGSAKAAPPLTTRLPSTHLEKAITRAREMSESGSPKCSGISSGQNRRPILNLQSRGPAS
jgi:hypothetical protein